MRCANRCIHSYLQFAQQANFLRTGFAGWDLTCVVRMHEGNEMAPKRRQLTLRRTEGSTGVSKRYRPRAMSIPRSTPGRQYREYYLCWVIVSLQ